MGIHKLVRREKREWQRIRDVRDLEAVRHGYNELKLTVQTEKPEPYIESIVDQVLDLAEVGRGTDIEQCRLERIEQLQWQSDIGVLQ